MSLGTNLSELRIRAGLSQDALAEKLDVSRQSVSKWETDTSVPELEKLVRLAELFGVTLDELVLGAKPAPTEPGPAPGTVVRETLPGRKIAGIVFFVISGVLAVLALMLVGLDCLFFALPFFACGVVCFKCDKRIVLWCVWAWVLAVDALIGFNTGNSAGLLFVLFVLLYHHGVINTAEVLAAGVMPAIVVGMTVWTILSFRGIRLARTWRSITLAVGLWVMRLAVLPYLYNVVEQSILNGDTQLVARFVRLAHGFYNPLQDTLIVAAVTVTALLLKRRAAE